jgi:hypothetical protein
MKRRLLYTTTIKVSMTGPEDPPGVTVDVSVEDGVPPDEVEKNLPDMLRTLADNLEQKDVPTQRIEYDPKWN